MVTIGARLTFKRGEPTNTNNGATPLMPLLEPGVNMHAKIGHYLSEHRLASWAELRLIPRLKLKGFAELRYTTHAALTAIEFTETRLHLHAEHAPGSRTEKHTPSAEPRLKGKVKQLAVREKMAAQIAVASEPVESAFAEIKAKEEETAVETLP